MINTKAIRKRMIDLDVSTNELAQAISKKPVTLRQKITNYRPMSLEEAIRIQEVLRIPDDMFRFYFFHDESRSVTKND